MKYIKWFIIIMIISLQACTKDKLVSFGLNYFSDFTVPATIPINSPVPLFTPDIKYDHQQEFEQNNTHINLVREVKLTKLDLEILSPDGQTFRFLNSVELFLNAEGLPEIMVAYKNNIPTSQGKHLSLDLTGEDLTEYIKKESFSLKARTVTREIITNDIKIGTELSFSVKAKVL